jgi:hypothetical protein
MWFFSVPGNDTDSGMRGLWRGNSFYASKVAAAITIDYFHINIDQPQQSEMKRAKYHVISNSVHLQLRDVAFRFHIVLRLFGWIT